MGLLDRAGFGQPWRTPPFFPQQPAEGAGLPTPPVFPNNKGPMPAAPQQGWAARLNSGFQNLNNSPLFTLGMSLLGNAQGSNWGGVGQDMREYGAQQMQRQALDNEMRRQKVGDARDEQAFGRQQTDWQRQDQQYSAYERAVQSETDPTRRQQLLALGPQGYGEYLTNREQMNWRSRESQLDREAQLRAANIAASAREQPRPMTPQFRTNVRSQFETARQLRESYNNFVALIQNADTPTLMGIGPRGAELAAAQRLLAIQAKSPAALDLGALVGADFAILDDIIGNPQNWRQLVQTGGREGVIQRLAPFNTFMNQGVSRLRGTYQDYADQFPEYYQPDTLPTTAPAAPAQSAQQSNGAPLRSGQIYDGYRYMGGDPNDQRSWSRVQDEQPGNYRGR